MRPRLIASIVILTLGTAAPALAGPLPGDRLESFTLPDASGRPTTWKPGRATVLSFCAFWCDTWIEQARRMKTLKTALRMTPAHVITVSVDGRWAEQGRGKVPSPLLLDGGATLRRHLDITAVPYTIVTDPSGTVRYAVQGIARSSHVAAVVRDILGGRPSREARPLYLAFDDFPSGPADEALLDTLKAEKAKATFFCIGRNLKGQERTLRRATAEGHCLQTHSWGHDATAPDIPRCLAEHERVTGLRPSFYHPPGRPEFFRLKDAADGPRLEPARRRLLVNPYDYTRPGAREIERRVLMAAKAGAVVLLHAGVGETIEALPRVLRTLRKRGFRLEVLR